MGKPGVGTDIQAMEFNNSSVAFDPAGFNTLVLAQGVTLVHWQAMPDPIGLLDKFDNRRPDATYNNNVFNGYYYKKMGVLNGIMSNNTKEAKTSAGGVVDAGTAQLTAHTHYLTDDKLNISDKRVYLTPMDRLYLDESTILVPRGELVEASITGVDTLNFPCEQVLNIVDSDGIEYNSECYQITNGLIKWVGNRPTFNIEANKGKVYSIKYLLKPFYYIDRMIHELRVTQAEDEVTGKRNLVQINQSCIVHREYIYQTKAKAPEDQDQKGSVPRPTE